MAADLTAANVADNEAALALLAELPAAVRFVTGDLHCNAPTGVSAVNQRLAH